MAELRGLTSLRGFAAFYVVLYHFSNETAKLTLHGLLSLAPRGFLAVDLFFVLSGFVMAYNYAPDFARRGLRAHPAFLLKRVARIVPLSTATVAALLLLSFIITGNAPSLWLASCNFLMLQAYGVCANLNSPSWTIGIEWVPYFLLPILLAVAVFGRWPACLMAIGAACLGLVALAWQRPPLSTDSVALGAGWSVLRCVCEFTFGLVAYRLYAAKWGASVFSSDLFLVLLFGTVAAIVLLRLGDLFAALLFPAIVVAVAANRGWPARFIGWMPFHFLGLISFSLYMIHEPLVGLELDLAAWLHPAPLSKPLGFAAILLGSLSIVLPAWLTFTAVERPGRRLTRTLFGASRSSMRQPV